MTCSTTRCRSRRTSSRTSTTTGSALTALATGSIAYVDRPLYDYVQHGNASLGHAAANRMTSLRERLARQRTTARPGSSVAPSLLRRRVPAAPVRDVLELRCGSRMSRRKRRALAALESAERLAPGAAASGPAGRARADGHARDAGRGVDAVPRAAVAAAARRGRRTAPAPPAAARRAAAARRWRSSRAPRRSIRTSPRWPTRSPRCAGRSRTRLRLGSTCCSRRSTCAHFFGGYIAKLNLARQLVEAGLRARIVTVDPVGPLPPGWRRTLEGYSGLAGLFDDGRGRVRARGRRRSRSARATASSPPRGGRRMSRRRRSGT